MKIQNLLSEHSIHTTYPRRAILQAIRLLGKRHFSADDLLHHLKQKRNKASRASVYRTLGLFSEKGVLKTIDAGRDFHLYELAHNIDHHDHIYCLRCGKIMEFSESSIERFQNAVCKRNDFYPISHTLRIVGLCKKCKGSRAK